MHANRIRRRLFPLIATAGLILVGISSTIWWGPAYYGKTAWALPNDLWGTLLAASRLLHGNLAGLYTHPTGLITLPGGAIILVPVVAIIDAAGISLAVQSAHNPQPAAWLLAGPYQTAISGIALFAADAIAEHVGTSRLKRALLAGAGAVALWNVSIRWGHPEDAVAVGLLLYAVLALSKSRPGEGRPKESQRGQGQYSRAAWLTGAAVAVQPLVLLALPVICVAIRPRRLPGFIARAAAPGVVLLGAAAAANWHATITAVTSQPNWPSVDHPTPWIALTTPLSGGAVAAEPVRLIAIAVACLCAIPAARSCRAAWQRPTWDTGTLLRLLWWVAVALAIRCFFEPVMVAFYLWPAMAVALVTATTTWPRLLGVSVLAGGLTFASQASWHGRWTWWTPMVAGLALTLLLARVRTTRLPAAEPSCAEPASATAEPTPA